MYHASGGSDSPAAGNRRNNLELVILKRGAYL